MPSKQFRVESDVPFTNRLLPSSLTREAYSSWNVAVAVAAKCVTQPDGYEMRVVNLDSGEVIFRTHSNAKS